MVMWSTEPHAVQSWFSTKDSSVLEVSPRMSAYRGGTYSTSVALRVATGTAVCGDKGTLIVWGLDGVLRTSNTGMTGTGEAGLTSQSGKTGCCSAAAGFAAANKTERFRRSVPLSIASDKVRSVFLSFPCHTAIPIFISYPNLATRFKCWQFI